MCKITGMSLVAQSIREPGMYSSGLTVETNRLWNKISARLRRLDDFARRLTTLEKKHSHNTPMSTMELTEILDYLPHRYPFLMIDRVIEFIPGTSLVALKNVTFNEPYFLGHFPGHPIMPGVLIIEALAQATGILAFRSEAHKPDKNIMYYLVGVDKARFKKPVVPGDQLHLEVSLQRLKRGVGVFQGAAKVNEQLVASAEVMCAKQQI